MSAPGGQTQGNHSSNQDRVAVLPYVSIVLLSACVLGQEILLMRLFAIIQWHHFAYMVISLALLGFGASGTFVSLYRDRLLQRFDWLYPASIAALAVFGYVAFLLAQQFDFHPDELLWRPLQIGRLAIIYILLALPFFCAGTALAMLFARFHELAGRVYGADLLGAGLGSVIAVLTLFVALPLEALRWMMPVGLVGAASALLELRSVSKKVGLGALLVAVLSFFWPAEQPRLELSPYKQLSQTLRIPGARVVGERSSPLGLVNVVSSEQVPLRHAPGLGMLVSQEPPPQLGLFTDGAGLTVVNRFRGDFSDFRYLAETTSALPYALGQPEQVLILGAGGGTDVIKAAAAGVARIDIVELNGQLIDLVRKDYADFSGRLYERPGLTVHVADARGFVAGSHRTYDLVELVMLDSFTASTSGLYALNESYLYTVEALAEYLAHTAPSGHLAISRWLKLPPRDSLKLMATAIAALEKMGVREPGRHLLFIRGWQSTTLVVKPTPLTGDEIAAAREFSRQLNFDLIHAPGMEQAEANRYNKLDEPYFYLGARALLAANREDFLDAYKFDIRPASDDSPFFFHFFKWGTLPEILGLRGAGGMALLESGYVVLLATLGQAVIASVLLIYAPLWWRRGYWRNRVPAALRRRVLVYFFALGLAFMFVEMVFIQKFILYLHHPIYAAAVALASFLVFAGIGSACSRRLGENRPAQRTVGVAVGGIVAIGAAYILGLDSLMTATSGWSTFARVAVCIAAIAPLGFCMGLPFPIGIRALGRHADLAVPWAWGINGCASVTAAVLASLLAMNIGFGSVLWIALSLYLLAGMNLPLPRPRDSAVP